MTSALIYDDAASEYRPAEEFIATQPECVREALRRILSKIDSNTLTTSQYVAQNGDGLWRCMVVGEGNRWVNYNFARDEKALKPSTNRFVKDGDVWQGEEGDPSNGHMVKFTTLVGTPNVVEDYVHNSVTLVPRK